MVPQLGARHLTTAAKPWIHASMFVSDPAAAVRVLTVLQSYSGARRNQAVRHVQFPGNHSTPPTIHQGRAVAKTRIIIMGSNIRECHIERSDLIQVHDHCPDRPYIELRVPDDAKAVAAVTFTTISRDQGGSRHLLSSP